MKMRIAAVLLICLVVPAQMKRTPGKDANHISAFETWVVTSGVSGGKDGRNRAFSVDNSGTVLFEDRRNKAAAEMKTVDAETLAQMESLLKQLDLPNAKRKSNDEKPECCDKLYAYTIVKLDGLEYHTSNLNFGISQTSNYERLLSVFNQTVSKNETILMNKAAELKIRNAKTLFVWVTDTNARPVWEGTFSKQGESNFFEGEWKNNGAQTIVKDKVEVLLSGPTVRIMGNGTDKIGLPKEFEGNWNPYQPGIIGKPILQNEINWTARFE
jgi:hypothetical protein